ncbi:Cupredoxin superfamily protein [Forsythia ovata]|uniref:Cupredoxin superfamily protein n=1 Tax=Forsythia ovata TaxID=205694 RepID=A0ABD1PH57_9LAMI
MSAVYKVGDKAGWNARGTDYNAWVAGKNFKVGDIIVFQYGPKHHNLLQVSKQDYETCTCSAPLATYTSGRDSIKIQAAEKYYFICGFQGHCQAGQKVAISTTSNANDCSTLSSYNGFELFLVLVASYFLAVQIR